MHNFTQSDIIEYKNFFDESDYEKILEYLRKPKWEFGHTTFPPNSPHFKDSIPFWKMELSDEEFFNDYLLNIIRQKTQLNLTAYNVYANGQTYGQHGYPHVDSYDEVGRTFLLYAVPNWDIMLGGKTAYVIDKDNFHHVIPERNKAVLFPGMIPHFSEETTRVFAGLRVTVAWKLNLE